MVSRDSAASYARDRHAGHVAAFHRQADALLAHPGARDIPGDCGGNVVVPHLDARVLG